ncbi:mesoderm posterior aa [Brachyhypopomus gauderio]|uniref:mesoderm posterior aa n=1 Tax=Brachyhypopomus gauderio TaxID=698409 RepID=UPI00404380BE
MDISDSLLQLQDSTGFLFHCGNLVEQSYAMSDAGYHSACSSLSPASSTESCCFSPPSFHHGGGQGGTAESSPATSAHNRGEERAVKPAKRTGRPRTKFPGVKRQNASEREKLRMRDLTKALHHLRTYLPPSVAPVGQTLTKIETLRLTIRYISHLSAQLGLSEEETAHGNLAEETQTTDRAPVFHTEQFNPATTQTQISPAQEFLHLPYYQETDNSGLPSVLDFWFP